MNTDTGNSRSKKSYSIRAIDRPTPDVERLTELVIRLAIQRRELAKKSSEELNPKCGSGSRQEAQVE